MSQDNIPPQLNNLTNLGDISQRPPVSLPPSVDPKPAPKYLPLQEPGIVKNLNARRDLNTTHDFTYWAVRDAELNDYSAFNDLHTRVLANREMYNNFSGNPDVDFTNFSLAERQYYSDFLGINFSKIGHAIGNVGTDIGHAIRGAAVGVAHGVRSIGQDTGHAAVAVEKNVVQHTEKGLQAARNHLQQQIHGTEAAFKAVAPYWKDALVIAGGVALALTGVGIPLALALVGAGLTAVNQPGTPQLPPGFGMGGTGSSDDGGFGMPGIDDQGDDGDTGEGLTPEALAQRQAQPQQQQEIADAEAAAAQARRLRIILIASGVVAVVMVWYFFFRKK